MRKNFYKPKTVPIWLQANSLKKNFEHEKCTVTRTRLKWIGWLQPTVLSRKYKIEVDYQMNGYPYVWVREPDLNVLAEGRNIPHLYDKEKLQLCLCLPEEWNPHRIISKTLLPLAAMWLFYFEIWLATGEWTGGGTTH